LAGTLDGARIIRIAGDKNREIFQTEVLEILLHDEDAGMIRAPYSYYEGFKDKDPFPFGEGLASQIILSGQPSLMGSSEDHSNEGALILSASDETMSERRSWPLTGRLA